MDQVKGKKSRNWGVIYNSIIITFTIVVFFLWLVYRFIINYIVGNNENYKEDKEDKEDGIPTVSFPFKNIYDDKGKKLNIIAITAPFRSKEHEELYDSYKKKGLSFIGISSYLDFPNHIDNPHEDRYHEKQNHDYPSMVKAWLYCFRKPGYTDKFKHLPHLLLTESDLKSVKEEKEEKEEKEDKEYDFIYCCLKDNDKCEPGWQSYNRNWDLAKKCLEVFCRDFKLRGIIVGREECEFTKHCEGVVKVVPFLPYSEFQKLIKKSKWLFVPNISDASPRVITESMCHNLPVLLNQNILGGWHNLVPGVTGEFFNDEKDVGKAVQTLLDRFHQYQPKKWYRENRGREEHSGVLLIEFLKENYPDLNNKNSKYAYMY